METEPRPAARIEDLLGHAAWVRGLAHSLVRDAGAADDLVQETWLAALRSPPPGGGATRGPERPRDGETVVEVDVPSGGSAPVELD